MVLSRWYHKSFFNYLLYTPAIVIMQYQSHLFFYHPKKKEIYQTMVDEIIQLAPAWQPQRVMMDFEKDTINVFNRTFSAVELTREGPQVFKPFRPHLSAISRSQWGMKNLKRIHSLVPLFPSYDRFTRFSVYCKVFRKNSNDAFSIWKFAHR